MGKDKAKEEPVLDSQGGEIEEQVHESDFDNAFNEFDFDTEVKPDAKPKDAESKATDGDPGKPADDDATPSPDRERDDKGRFKPKDDDGGADGEAGEEDTSATAKLQKMAEAADATEPAPKQDEAKAEATKKAEPEPPKQPAVDDKFLDNAINAIQDEQQRTKVTETLNDEFPELKPLFQSMAAILAGVTVNPAAAAEAAQDGEQAVQPQTPNVEQAEIARMRLLYECERQHAGSIQTAESPEFQEWLGKQPAGVQKLADSGDPDTSVTVIQAYQESKAKDAARKHDEGKQANRGKKNDLHKTTAKPNQGKRNDEGDTGNDAFADAFDEYASKEKDL